MAQAVDKYILEITADNTDAIKKIQDLGGKVKKFETQNQSMFEKIKSGWLIVSAAVAGYVLGMSKLLKAGIEAEKASLNLASALKATGQYTRESMKSLEDFANQLIKTTGVSDEQTKSMLSMAINLGLTSDQAKEATKNAIILAKVYDLDMNMAMKSAIAFQEGNTQALTRAIPTLRGVKDETERMAKVNDALKNGLVTLNAEMDSMGGKQTVLKELFGEITEVIGQVLAKALKPFVEFLIKMFDIFLKMPAGIQTVISIMGMLTATLITANIATKALGISLKALSVGNVIGLLATALAGLSAVAVTLGADMINLGEAKLKVFNKDMSYKDIKTEEDLKANIVILGTYMDALKKAEKAKDNFEIVNRRLQIGVQEQRIAEASKRLTPGSSAGAGVTVIGPDQATSESAQSIIDASNSNAMLLEMEAQYLDQKGMLREAEALREKQLLEQGIADVAAKALLDVGATQESVKRKVELYKFEQEQKKNFGVNMLATTKEVLAQAAGMMSSQIEWQFNLGKGAAIAQASINTFQSITKALADLGPAGIPFSVALGALGAIQIANIASQKFTAPKAARGALVDGSQLVEVGEKGRELILPNNITESIMANVAAGRSGGNNNIVNNYQIDGRVIDEISFRSFVKEITTIQTEILANKEA